MLSKRRLFYSTVALLAICSNVRSHSWLACTDYAEKGGSTWDPQKCRGFARAGHRKAHKDGIFGSDSGYDHTPNEQNPCQVSRNDMGEYTHDHPMAVYYPGQQVILVHPMKNHGADAACTNIHIPDTGNWIYRSERNGFTDPSLSEFRRKLVFDLGRSPTGKDFNGDLSLSSVYPKPGFQNAARFCDNTDKAMGTFVMNVPKDLRPGHYTFMWLWAFNSANNLYSSCFEVQIAQNKRVRDRKLKENGFTDTTEPCGGMTSNPQIRGSENDGCTPTEEYEYVNMPETPVTTTRAPFFFWQQPTASTKQFEWTTAASTTTTPEYEYAEDYAHYYGDYYGGNGGSYPDDHEDESAQPDVSSVDSDIELEMTLQQFSGEIKLPAPRSTAIRRYYAVDFGCDVQSASFWNSRITNEGEVLATNSPRRHYEIVQEGDKQLQNLQIFYHVNHKEPCDIVRFPPRIKIIREEYENI